MFDRIVSVFFSILGFDDIFFVFFYFLVFADIRFSFPYFLVFADILFVFFLLSVFGNMFVIFFIVFFFANITAKFGTFMGWRKFCITPYASSFHFILLRNSEKLSCGNDSNLYLGDMILFLSLSLCLYCLSLFLFQVADDILSAVF